MRCVPSLGQFVLRGNIFDPSQGKVMHAARHCRPPRRIRGCPMHGIDEAHESLRRQRLLNVENRYEDVGRGDLPIHHLPFWTFCLRERALYGWGSSESEEHSREPKGGRSDEEPSGISGTFSSSEGT